MSNQQPKAQQILKNKYIGQWLKVITKNGRRFQGKLMAVDFRGNLILHESVAQIPEDQNCELNYDLQNISDVKLSFKPALGLSEEEKKQKIREYMGSHYYFGSIMISGGDVASISIRKCLPAEGQKEKAEGQIQKAEG